MWHVVFTLKIFRILPIDLISNLCLYIALLKTLQHPTEAYTLRGFQLIQMFTVSSRKATRIKYQCINARSSRDTYFICQMFSSSTCIRRSIWLRIYTHTCIYPIIELDYLFHCWDSASSYARCTKWIYYIYVSDHQLALQMALLCLYESDAFMVNTRPVDVINSGILGFVQQFLLES